MDLGVKILKDDNEILESSDLVLQVGMLSDNLCSYINQNQTLIGALNPYNNKDKLESLVKEKNKYFFFRTSSKNYQSTINGYFIFSSKSRWL